MTQHTKLTEREREIIVEATAAARALFTEKIQEVLAAADHEAAANGNLWMQGRISGLQTAEQIVNGGDAL